MLLLLHETSQGTLSHVFDLDSTEVDEPDADDKEPKDYEVFQCEIKT